MATATATVGAKKEAQDLTFIWEGQDRTGKTVRGEVRAPGEALANVILRRQGIRVRKLKQQRLGRGRKVSDKDITFFTRQLAVMMKSGVPLLQAFDIVAKGHDRPTVERVWRMLDRAEYKRRQAPPGVRVSQRAFGRDWRYPITSGYRPGES